MEKNLAFFSLLLLTACSKPVKQELNIELSVDDTLVILARTINKKTEELLKSQSETNAIIQQACNFSEFQIKKTISSTVSDKNKKIESTSTTSTTSTVKPMSSPGKIIECAPDRFSCSLKDSTDGKIQVQYTLLLRDWLKEKYNMQQQATWRYESIERIDKPIVVMRIVRNMVAISDTELLCETQLITEEEK